MAELWTDVGIEQIEGMQGLDVDDAEKAMRVAARIYRYIGRNEGLAEEDLRTWANSTDITTDELNRSITILRSAGKLFMLDAAARVVATSSSASPTG